MSVRITHGRTLQCNPIDLTAGLLFEFLEGLKPDTPVTIRVTTPDRPGVDGTQVTLQTAETTV